MKKFFSGVLVLLASLSVFAQTPQGCNTQQIRSAFTGAGYIELTVTGQDCSMYFVNPTAQSADLSQQQAAALGGNMVVFNDAAENQNVVNALIAQNIFAISNQIWIGYKRSGAGASTFYALDNSTGPFTPGPSVPGLFQNWAAGEPNNNSYQCSPICGIGCNTYACQNGEQCVEIYSAGTWNDEKCDDGQSISVIEVNLCPQTTESNDTAVCPNQTLRLRSTTILGSQPYTYNWSSGQTTNEIYVTPAQTQPYYLTVTDRYNCQSYDTINVTLNTCQTPTGPQGCDIPLIINTFTNAGYIPLNVQGQPCSIYFVNPNSQDAAAAQAAAQQYGANMIVMNDAQENSNVSAALNTAGFGGQTIWLGYRRSGTNASTFYALDGSTGPFTPGPATPTLYQAWSSGEPNNSGYGSACAISCNNPFCSNQDKYLCQNGEQCVQIYPNGLWNDLPCDRTSISVIEINLCPDVNATVNNQTLFNLDKDTTVCAGATVNLRTTPIQGSTPYTYLWTPGGQTTQNNSVQATQTTQYTVRVTDRYGCFSEDQLTVDIQGTFNDGFTANPAQVCDGQTTTLTFNGTPNPTATFTWGLDGGTIVSGSATGPGPLEVRWSSTGTKNLTLDINDGSCTIPQATGTVTVNSNPVANAGQDQTICSGGVATLGGPPQGNYTYYWSPDTALSATNVANPIVQDTNLSSAPKTRTYYMIATINGCSSVDSLVLTIDPAQVAPTNPTGVVNVCLGGDTVITSTQTFAQYLWNTSATTQSITVSQSGKYAFGAIDAQGCLWRSDSVEVVVATTPLPVLISADGPNSFCQGGSVTLSTDVPYNTYNWSNSSNQPTITVGQVGTYNVSTTDADNCQGLSNDITVTIFTLPTVNGVVTDEQCYLAEDGSIVVTGANGASPYAFAWSNSQSGGNISGLAPGTYDVTVTDNNQCTGNSSFTVQAAPFYELLVDNVVDVTCFNGSDGSITVSGSGGTPGYSYLWNTTAQSATISNLPQGSYSVTVTDSEGCVDTTTITIAEPEEIVASLPEVAEIRIGQSLQLDAQVTPLSTNYSYQWSPATGLSCTDCPDPIAAPVKSINYSLIVKDPSGCADTLLVPMTVDPSKVLFIPNFFSPNDDNANELWCVFSDAVQTIEIRVFNRWGEKVFETEDIRQCWDGFMRGERVEPGTYVYYIRISYIDETWTERKGSLFVYR